MRYTKMHGAGNSFVLTENLHGELQGEDLSGLALRLCARSETDGMIVIVPAAADAADFGMLFYNADGSLGEMCGNGARCIARYGVEHGLARDPEQIRIVTESAAFAERLPRLFAIAFHVDFDEVLTSSKFTFLIRDREKIRTVFQTIGYSPRDSITLHVNYGLLAKDCCRLAFLPGLFCALNRRNKVFSLHRDWYRLYSFRFCHIQNILYFLLHL